MKKLVTLFTALSLLGSAVAFAGPPAAKSAKAAKPAAKLIDVWTCPMTGEKIADHKTAGGKFALIGNYRVHFCCPDCDGEFAKLSARDRLAKAQESAKKDAKKG